jgi:hypothetical protein
MSDIKIRIDQPYETAYTLDGEQVVIPHYSQHRIVFQFDKFGKEEYELQSLLCSLPYFETEAIQEFAYELISAVQRCGDDWTLTDWKGKTSFLKIVEEHLMTELLNRGEYLSYNDELERYVTKA